jgi:lipoate-protein ligase A
MTQSENSYWRIIPFEQHNAYYNMAIDEAIFRLYKKFKIKTLRLYSWKPSTVSIGVNQCLDDEINLSKVEELGFQAVRRVSGGGAVFHDSQGELTYSIVTSKDHVQTDSIEESYYEIIRMIFTPLIKLGITIDYDQIHCPSVFSNGKKISGNAQARSGNVILQHGTILLDYQPEIMYSVLKARPGKTESDMVASVYQKITTVSNLINKQMTPEELAKYLLENFQTNQRVTLKIGKINTEELSLAEKLVKSRYQTSDWLTLK